jgi:hypothetical protein
VYKAVPKCQYHLKSWIAGVTIEALFENNIPSIFQAALHLTKGLKVYFDHWFFIQNEYIFWPINSIVVLGQGSRTPVAGQAKSSTRGGWNGTWWNKTIDFIKLVPLLLHSPQGGYLYMPVDFLRDQNDLATATCPGNILHCRGACSPSGALACLR